MNDFELRQIFEKSKTIATVGFSTNPERPGYYVPQYLMEHGFQVIPVNPSITEILGQKAYADLTKIPEKIDVVQIFRPPEAVPAIVDQAIRIGAHVVWMQLGAANEEAAQRARDAGLTVVMNRCMMVEHRRLIGP